MRKLLILAGLVLASASFAQTNTSYPRVTLNGRPSGSYSLGLTDTVSWGDVCLTRSAAGVLKVTACSATLGGLLAENITITSADLSTPSLDVVGLVNVGATASMETVLSDVSGQSFDARHSPLYVMGISNRENAVLDNVGLFPPGVVFRMATGTAAAPAILADEQQIGYQDYRAYSGGLFYNVGGFEMHVEDAYVDGNLPNTYMKWSATTGGTNAERMRLSAAQGLTLGDATYNGVAGGGAGYFRMQGRLGVGTTAPGTKLHVVETTANNLGATFDVTSTGTTMLYVIGPSINNTSATANNRAGFNFCDSAGCANGAGAGIGAQFTNRTSHYGEIVLGGRSARGYAEWGRVADAGFATSAAYTVSMTADAALQFGSVVMPDAGTDGRFDVNTAGGTLAIGVLTGVGACSAGSAYNLATGGIAYVIPGEDITVTRGHVLYQHAGTAGYVNDNAALQAAGLNIGRALYSEPVTYIIDPTGCGGGGCVNVATETITLSAAPGWAVNDPVAYWNSGGTSIAGLVDGNVYFVKTISGADVTLSATVGGTAVGLNSQGDDATQYLQRLPKTLLIFQ